MKNHRLILAVCLSIFFAHSGAAQDVIRQATCYNEYIQKQVDSIKLITSAEGFVVAKESSVQMESEYEMPVIVPLSQGTWYRIIFIADPGSRLTEVRMYDWNEKQIIYQK